jgi:hypothetical protein
LGGNPELSNAPRTKNYSGVCWTKSEPILSKILTLIDAKLPRDFIIGERAKDFLP